MADLIIKPATGDGNKLILQDKDGGAVLTTADSGATVTNATLTAPIIDQVKLTPGSTPGSPAEGHMYYNSVTKVISVYNGSAWEQINETALGGLVTSYASGATTYRIHTFLTSGTFTLASTKTLDFLIIGGGGGGGQNYIVGGSGAGGMWVKTGVSTAAGSYPIVVGAGGSNTGDGYGHQTSSRGHSSSAFGRVAPGGGGGRSKDDSDDVGRGASGGGGAAGWSPAHSDGGAASPGSTVGSNGATDSGDTFYGAAGGNGRGSGGSYANSGGGGGAGGAGGHANQTSGDGARGGVGGVGLQNSFRTGSSQWYCAGGGGGTYYGNTESGMMNGIGGSGVREGSASGWPPNMSGTTSFTDADNSQNGVAHTGSGASCGQGGSGIVVIRYAI